MCIHNWLRIRKWRYGAVTIYRVKTLHRRAIDLNFLLTFRGYGRLIPPRFGAAQRNA